MGALCAQKPKAKSQKPKAKSQKPKAKSQKPKAQKKKAETQKKKKKPKFKILPAAGRQKRFRLLRFFPAQSGQPAGEKSR
ncbi:hypothetical protein GJQ54_05565 [Oceanospirillaceae bacterium ASx5O]|nr:hypothetical protein GJQ54_05565 [Oceanospirillaceae bacterium ASx5O]